MEERKLVPKRRFRGFTDEWAETELKEVAPLQRGFDLTRSNMSRGLYPVVFSNGIGAWNSMYKIKGPGVVTGRSGSIGNVSYIEQNYWPHNTTLWVTNFLKNYPLFIYYLYEKVDLSKFGSGSGVPTLNRNDVHDYSVVIPNPKEQQKIGEFFKVLDERIANQEGKIAKVKALKEAYLTEMFPQEGETVPKRRFKGFEGEWIIKSLSQVVKQLTDGDWIQSEHITDSGRYRIIQTGNIGVGKFISRDDSSRYINAESFNVLNANEIYPGDLLISRLAEPAGRCIILPNIGEKMVTAVDVAIIRKTSKFDEYFLMTLLNSDKILRIVNESVSGTSHKRISRSNLEKTLLDIPSYKEQQKIGSFFKNLDDQIRMEEAKLEKLKKMKEAYLEEMFV